MHTILPPESKETVNRAVPKAQNKIQAVAVARLYIAYPSKQRWTYTGLQGAAVLANDLIGNTYWIKMVDVSVSYAASSALMPIRSDTFPDSKPWCDLGSGDI